MRKLLILGPSYQRNPNPEPIPAIERYNGIFYKIVRKHMDKVKEKNIDIIIITENLDIVTSETKLPYKPPIGETWKTLPPITKNPERIEKLRKQILEIVENKKYDEIFITLNKYYQALLPNLTPYTKKIIAISKGSCSKAKL